VGVPVTKETIPPRFGAVGEFFGAKPKFRISIDDGGLVALGTPGAAGAPPPPPSTPAPAAGRPPASQAAPGGARIRVKLKTTGEVGTIPPEEFDPSLYERV
jgi:hypothetical protein